MVSAAVAGGSASWDRRQPCPLHVPCKCLRQYAFFWASLGMKCVKTVSAGMSRREASPRDALPRGVSPRAAGGVGAGMSDDAGRTDTLKS
eukprot:56271-Eustigmatos_ZCMA.PRE.1